MTTLVDTSAVYAFLDREDENHDAAVATFAGFRSEPLVTHNYVVVETAALVRRRLGPLALRLLFDDLLPFIEVVYIDESIHGLPPQR